MTDSICTDCSNKRRTWSADLAKEGYVGCCLLYDKPESVVNDIKAEVIATGWVVLGMATNDQLITKGTYECKYHD